MDERQEGIPFIRRIIKQKDILAAIDEIEPRFLPDGDKDFLKIVVEQLGQGKRVKIEKVKAE